MENIFILSNNRIATIMQTLLFTWISRKPKALPITEAVKSLPPLPKVVISPVLHPCRWKLHRYILVMVELIKTIELFLKLLLGRVTQLLIKWQPFQGSRWLRESHDHWSSHCVIYWQQLGKLLPEFLHLWNHPSWLTQCQMHHTAMYTHSY